jgi:hypothetical protein
MNETILIMVVAIAVTTGVAWHGRGLWYRARCRGGTQPGWVGLSFTERIREEQLDRIALVKAVAASIGVEVAAHFKRIELRVGDVDRPEMEAVPPPPAKCLHSRGRGGTCFSRGHETCFRVKRVTP